MKVITLTTDQLTALAPLKATQATACTAHQAAVAAVQAELAAIATAAGVTAKHPRLSLSDDGNSLIVQ
jgi:hypothetical protein